MKPFLATTTLHQIPKDVDGLVPWQAADAVHLHRPGAFHPPGEPLGLLHRWKRCHKTLLKALV